MASDQPSHVLFVDDDLDEYLFFKEALESLKIRADLSYLTSCDQLLDYLENPHAPDPGIIFLDLNMPGLTGVECLIEIKKRLRGSNIPIIIYTTSTFPKDIDDCHNGGAYLYVIKPASFSKLRAIVADVFAIEWNSFRRPSKQGFVFP